MDYDKIYDFVEGWIAYSKNANTYLLRNRLLSCLEKEFASEMSTKEYNKHLRTTNVNFT